CLTQMPLFSSPFFFSCYHPPLELHSFPTRRSSDLEKFSSMSSCSKAPRGLFAPGQKDPVEQIGRVFTAIAISPSESLRQLSTREDRKSTRLNSSHVAISYAVFCLKKKKKNE